MNEIAIETIHQMIADHGSVFNGDVKVADIKNVIIDEIGEYKISNLGRVLIRKWVEVEFRESIINYDRLDLLGVARGPDGEYSMADTHKVTQFVVIAIGRLTDGAIKKARVTDVYFEGLNPAYIMVNGRIPPPGQGAEVIFSDP